MLDNWNLHIKRLLKAEMVKRGVDNQQLVDRLNSLGITITKAGLANKISRGSFTAAFFNQCLYVLGCDSLEINAPRDFVADEIETRKRIKNKK